MGPEILSSKIAPDALEAAVGAGEAGEDSGRAVREVVQVKGMGQVGMQAGWVGFGGSNLWIVIDMKWEGAGETGSKERSLSFDSSLTRD